MDKDSKIYVAGHNGMVGSAIVRKLSAEGYINIVTRGSQELDLRNQQGVTDFFASEKPEYVFLAAARVGGIMANNTYRAEFIYDNLAIETNVIHHAYKSGVTKLMLLGSSCIYPKMSPQPMKEEYILTGELEHTNEPYAVAKIAGFKMCQAYRAQYGCNFITCMPTNLYGPNDNYDLDNSHVLPALLSKFHTAKQENEPTVEIWGTGNPQREFLHVDDLADACLFLMLNYNEPELINVGTGRDISIKELAELIKAIVGYSGELQFDTSKPDGTRQKLLDVDKIHNFGWHHNIGLTEGITAVYNDVSQQETFV